MRFCSPSGSNHLFASCTRFSIGNIVSDRTKEQERLLKNDADVAAILIDRKRPNVGAIHQDSTTCDIIKSTHEIDQRALTSPAGTNQANHLAGLNFQTHVVDHLSRTIAKRDIPYFNLPRNSAWVDWLLWFRNARNTVQDLKDAVRCSGCSLGIGQ